MLKKQMKALEEIISHGYNETKSGGFEYNGKYYVFNPFLIVAFEQQEEVKVSRELTDNSKLTTVASYMENPRSHTIELKLPTMEEMKAILKEKKYTRRTKEPFPFKAGDGKDRWMNPFYVMDIYNALNIGREPVTAYVSENILKPIYFHSGDNEAILLPCRPPMNKF